MNKRFSVAIAILFLLLSGVVASRYAVHVEAPRATVPAAIFRLPEIRSVSLQAGGLLRECYRSGRHADGLLLVEQLLKQDPQNANLWFLKATFQVCLDRGDAAVASLYQAVRNGFSEPQRLLQDPEFHALRSDARFPLLIRKAAVAATRVASGPAIVRSRQIEKRTAVVDEANTFWSDRTHSLVSVFVESAAPAGDYRPPVIQRQDAVAELLNGWVRDGSAAGFRGVLYDNRDRDHSTLPRAVFSDLAFVEYAPAVQLTGSDFGAHPEHRFTLPTFGNSSTANVGNVLWCSNARRLANSELKLMQAMQAWGDNHLYCYPEHEDYDAVHGDVFAMNLPCWVISQGSSGSDQPFLEAIAMCLAAFSPDVRTELQGRGQLMQATQWVMRQCWNFIGEPEDYFSGRAHAVVAQGSELNVERMVRLAHQLTVDQLPPQVAMNVVQESRPTRDEAAELAVVSEVLLNSPVAIGRVHRTRAYTRRMVVDVSGSVDPQARKLTYRWVVLQGQPDHVRIRPLVPGGSKVEILIDWHEPFGVPWNDSLQTARVDVGVFAENGVTASLPGVISTYFPPTQSRVYSNDMLLSVDYVTRSADGVYADPLVEPARGWTDRFSYAAGSISSWSRENQNGDTVQFNAQGMLLQGDGKPPLEVIYRRVQPSDQGPQLQYSILQ